MKTNKTKKQMAQEIANTNPYASKSELARRPTKDLVSLYNQAKEIGLIKEAKNGNNN